MIDSYNAARTAESGGKIDGASDSEVARHRGTYRGVRNRLPNSTGGQGPSEAAMLQQMPTKPFDVSDERYCYLYADTVRRPKPWHMRNRLHGCRLRRLIYFMSTEVRPDAGMHSR